MREVFLEEVEVFFRLPLHLKLFVFKMFMLLAREQSSNFSFKLSKFDLPVSLSIVVLDEEVARALATLLLLYLVVMEIHLGVKCLVGLCGFQKLQTWSQWFTNYTRGPKTCQKCTRLVPSPNIS
ncbi:hypothetical protein Hanom_Chr07g00678701 [Helianthus anomalus]